MTTELATHSSEQVVLTQAEQARIAAARADSYAKSTRGAYRSRVRLYTEWLKETGRSPALAFEPTVVLAYLTTLAESVGLSTVEQSYAAILRAAKDAGADVESIKSHGVLTDALRGIRRSKTRSVQTRKARALEKAEIRRLLRQLSDEEQGSPATALRDRVMLLVGTALGVRGAELAAIRFGDVAERHEMGGIEVTILRSKTSDEPQVLAVARLAEVHRDACPVRALEAWREYVRKTLALDDERLAETAVLLQVRRGGHLTQRGTSGEAVTDGLRRLCRRAGVSPDVSSHSLRSTYATQALDAAVPIDAVMAGRWGFFANSGWLRPSVALAEGRW